MLLLPSAHPLVQLLSLQINYCNGWIKTPRKWSWWCSNFQPMIGMSFSDLITWTHWVFVMHWIVACKICHKWSWRQGVLRSKVLETKFVWQWDWAMCVATCSSPEFFRQKREGLGLWFKGLSCLWRMCFWTKRSRTSGALQEKEMVGDKMGSDVLESSKDGFGGTNEWNKEYVDVSEVVNSPSGNYIEFPFNFLASFAVLLMKFYVFLVQSFGKFFHISNSVIVLFIHVLDVSIPNTKTLVYILWRSCWDGGVFLAEMSVRKHSNRWEI